MKLDMVLTPVTVRNYPNASLPKKRLAVIDAALNERFGFQAALRSEKETWIRASISGPDGWTLRVRRVGLVPVPHHNTPIIQSPLDTDGIGHLPGFSPDPLFDENVMLLPQDETNAFWFTVIPPKKAVKGDYKLTVTIEKLDHDGKATGRPTRASLKVRLHNVRIQPRKNFDVTHWFYNDCIIDRYNTDLFDERFWTIFEAYVRDIVEHGQNVLYVPIFTPALDTDKRPSQLLKVKKCGKDRYSFDWSDVRRYIRTAKKCGITTFECCHLFSQWGCKFALKIYEGQGKDEKLLWPADTPACSDTYRKFLSQLLPELKALLKEEKVLSKSLFHISDEPGGDEAKANYKAANEMIHQLAPWIRCIDAVSQLAFGKEGIIDIPVPSVATALDFRKEGIDSWCYYCCGPRGEYIQHLIDTPLAKVAMHGLIFYRWPFKGFLHWGLNYWNKCQTRTPIDPYSMLDAGAWPGWAYGDTFYIYPGKDGPVDSIRWEVFAEALQDYALLQTLGVDPESSMLRQIKSFSDFPKDPLWRTRLRAKLFAEADK